MPDAPSLPLYVGTSGWAYTIWKPDFYPKEVSSKNFLKYYATQLTAVEVNYTFRRQLSEKAATGWMADVGPNFRFALKANQYITHIRRLQNVEEAMQRFLPTLQPLATQLGPVLFQLPPTAKADVAVLRDFLALLPTNFKAAFEFRHAVVVQRRDLSGAARAQRDAVHRRDREAQHARGPHRQLHLFSLPPAQLFG